MSVLRAARDGAAAGTVATVAMSAIMYAAGKAGLMGEQPPRRISRVLLSAAGRHRRSEERSEREEQIATAATHLAFGVGAGGMFEVLRRSLPWRAPAVPAGILWGMAVWAISYAGWIPAFRILALPHKDRSGRPESMIAAHLVYGAVLGARCARKGHN